MSNESDRGELRRATDRARRLRKAADVTAGRIGALTTEPKTPKRSEEYARLSKLLDDTDAKARYWETIAEGMQP